MSTLICWKNLLKNATYVMTAGTDSSNAPVANVWNGRTARPAFPVSDASGVVQITFDLTPSAIGLGELPLGWGPAGGVYKPDTFIFGAERNDPIGYRFAGGRVLVEAYVGTAWITVIDEAMIYDVNESVTFPIVDHESTLKYRLTVSGQPPLAAVPLPELFLGEAMRLGGVDYRFDPNDNNTVFSEFNAYNGYSYQIIRSKKFIAKPKWSLLPRDYDATVNFFRKTITENMTAFWWVFDDNLAHETYLVKHKIGNARFPIMTAAHRVFALDLEEVIL